MCNEKGDRMVAFFVSRITLLCMKNIVMLTPMAFLWRSKQIVRGSIANCEWVELVWPVT